ncbi:MAG TPA: hypothetical protein VMI12_11920 [Puia sp.]|nr:hypothetical protein [Puia sp.]
MIPLFISWLFKDHRNTKISMAWQQPAINEKNIFHDSSLMVLIANLKYYTYETDHI